MEVIMIEDHLDLFGSGEIPGYLSIEDIGAIELLSKKIKPNGTLVEIGSFLGKSAAEWAKHLPDSKIICIDGFNSPYHVLEQLLIQADFEVPQGPSTHRQLFDYYTQKYNNIFAIEGFFNKTFGYPSKADFVFEDSTHTGEYLEFALPFWWQHIKSGGILAGHDYDNEVKTTVDLFAIIYNTKIHTVAEGSSIWYTIKDER